MELTLGFNRTETNRRLSILILVTHHAHPKAEGKFTRLGPSSHIIHVHVSTTQHATVYLKLTKDPTNRT